MQFTPKTEKELAEEGLLKTDNYDFEVLNAENAISQKGNPMIKLKLNVFGPDGRGVHIFDYLMEAMAFKLRHFCDGAGLIEKYESGKLDAADCVGRTGKAFIRIESDKNGVYPDKNVVKDYWKKEQIEKGTAADVTSQDDIPF
jgi:hypothetical protein